MLNNNTSGGCVGEIGKLKVVVVQGKSLVIRDFRSSDPYVILTLGHQEVFDKDRFKADDKMGYAPVNVQLLASASRLKQVLKVSSAETATLRKVIPDSENCLVRESYINCVNGDIVQEVCLRLCGVESGEIHLKLKLETAPNPTSLSS